MSRLTKKAILGAVLISAVLSVTATGCAGAPAPTQITTQ